MDKDVRPVLLVDGLNVFMRHYVVNPTMSSMGFHVGGFVGFLKSLSRLCDRTRPAQVIVAWEGGGSPRRRAVYNGYKKNRRPQKLNRYYLDDIPDTTKNRDNQIALVIAALKNTPVQQVYVPDCEADDVLAYLVKYKFNDTRSVIVSSDKDFYQLLSKCVIQWSPGQKKYVTPKTVLEKYNISPTNFCTARCFTGDPSDGLDGVPRVGLKSLARRFPELASRNFVSVDDLIASAEYAREDKSLIIYDNMVQYAAIAKRNWKLMHLDLIGLSADQVQRIDFSIENSRTLGNKLGLIKMLVSSGIQNFDADSFFASVSANVLR